MTAVRQAFTRESADARRADLIEATAAVLAEHGLAGTNVRAICARAGVSPGLLRHYFCGIDDLVAATYQATSDRTDAIFADAVDGAGPDPPPRPPHSPTPSCRTQGNGHDPPGPRHPLRAPPAP